MTPGNQKTEILRVVASLRDHYDQIVLFGYPPFLKDVIDSGRAEGFDWSRSPVRLVMAGEVFSEEWRSLVTERLGASDPSTDTASLYGTADGGVLANETPLSIQIRRFLSANPAAAKELFGEARLPTLCQYDLFHRYFEAEGGELVFSGESGVPLVRYGILDRGGLVSYDDMLSFVARHGFDPIAALDRTAAARVRHQPFVFVFGRTNFAVSIYGANVFPENVSVGLEQTDVAPYVTGKFVLQVTGDVDLDAKLDLAVELAAGVDASHDLAARVAASVRLHVERLNSEFANYAPSERRTPNIRLLPLGDPEYFPPGVETPLHAVTVHGPASEALARPKGRRGGAAPSGCSAASRSRSEPRGPRQPRPPRNKTPRRLQRYRHGSPHAPEKVPVEGRRADGFAFLRLGLEIEERRAAAVRGDSHQYTRFGAQQRVDVADRDVPLKVTNEPFRGLQATPPGRVRQELVERQDRRADAPRRRPSCMRPLRRMMIRPSSEARIRRRSLLRESGRRRAMLPLETAVSRR